MDRRRRAHAARVRRLGRAANRFDSDGEILRKALVRAHHPGDPRGRRQARGLNVGAQIAYEGGRLARESDFLRSNNVPDINPGASVGLHVEWDRKLGPVPVTLLARGRHFTDSDRGAQADLRLTAIVFGGGAITAAVFVQGTWADSKSNQSFYDMAGSGPLYASGGLLWGVDLSREWIVVGNLEARRLQGDAARSPLAERRSNHYANASLAYRF